MSIFIVGGSNSIYRDGWSSEISGAHNLSVGANTTLCGIFRCLLDDGPQSGDTIIWEYALNEIVHVRELYAQETLLRNLEHFLRLAGRNNWKVLPLLLVPRQEEIYDIIPDYYYHAIDLFKHYGLNTVDVSAEFRNRFGSVPSSHYSDPVHFRRDADVTGEIGRMVKNALPDAMSPREPNPIRTSGDIVALNLERSSRFANSLMSIPLTEMPLSIHMEGSGVIRSVVVICKQEDASGLRVQLTRPQRWRWKRRVVADSRISTTCRNDKTLLKALNLDNVADWSFEPGDILSIRYIKTGGAVYAEQGLKARLRAVTIPDRDTLAGILVERYP
ncbi:hypothetical protein [Paracoccus sp. (in: a-proteobacteria)]|uniref:hypothetical protein n=1 Tax=Paracoccus sp. TaxID=267 RepID=UPI0028AD7BBB|nr:hypothetical protein [Paracoccus sp. (in: a-proteobacteria)]